jgi:anti-sigma regulatory factor (Ser/Thr protein kinase)
VRGVCEVRPPSGVVVTGGWSRWSFLEFGALPSAVPCARLHARQLLWEWGLRELIEVTELVVSELVTNAVQAGGSPDECGTAVPVVGLWLVTDDVQVLVQVSDANPRPPQPAVPGADAENGRGLLLVETLSAGWGWCTVPGRPGKAVWALCRI